MAESLYNTLFFEGNRRFATESAERIVPLVLDLLNVRSVVDFGCAEGVWLNAWAKVGVDDHFGVDGPQVDRTRLLIEQTRFEARELASCVDLGRRFDLVQSLEVAEHIDGSCAEQFVDNLVRHSDLVLFSAAPPGQGGRGHVNEQPYGYWRAKFRKRGYRMFDCVRPAVARLSEVSPWYRYNIFVFGSDRTAERLPSAVLRSEVSMDDTIRDLSPPLYRARKAVIRQLPEPMLEVLYLAKRLAASRAG